MVNISVEKYDNQGMIIHCQIDYFWLEIERIFDFWYWHFLKNGGNFWGALRPDYQSNSQLPPWDNYKRFDNDDNDDDDIPF